MNDVRFKLGTIVVTPAARRQLSSKDIQLCLARHIRGDWGNVSQKDRGWNEWNLKHGGKLLSKFMDQFKNPLIIVTECDRSGTIIMLPGKY